MKDKLIGIIILQVTVFCSCQKFQVNIAKDGSYKIQVGGKTWLTSSPTFFNKDGVKWSTTGTGNNSLVLQAVSYKRGTDKRFKNFNETIFHYTFGDSNDTVLTSIRETDGEIYILFKQTYVISANETSLGGESTFNQTISGFPNFKVQNADEPLGFLSYGGYMFGDTDKTTGQFNSTTSSINDGIAGGPLVIFNKAGNSIIISPYDNYMAASLWHDGKPGGSVCWGIMGGVNSIPANFTYTTILVFDTTIQQTFFNWGNRLFERFDVFNIINRGLNASNDDSLNYLGYWTDNGAYYYYHTEQNKNYEDTLKDVKSYSVKQNIPYKYLQLDSWWYPKDTTYNATTKWEPKQGYFPHGFNCDWSIKGQTRCTTINPLTDGKIDWPKLKGFADDNLRNLSSLTGWKFVAHNRYWSKSTPYAKQNNGSFDWIIGTLGSLPNDIEFWRHLFVQAKDWGLLVYEQDWLNVQTQYMSELQTSLTLGRDWLMQMGQAAAENGLTIQYCMANPRHALQSIEIPVVTQGRVSDDYLFRRPKQYKIGVTSLFANAVRVVPYKDTFWTTSIQPGNPYGKSEPFPDLEAAVSSLSKGPVGPSDRIGLTNRDLLMKCCREDGMLLKPSRPALPIDKQLISDAFDPYGRSHGEIWMAQSFIPTNKRDKEYGILFAADVQGPMSVRVSDLHFNVLSEGIYYPYNNVNQWSTFNSSSVIDLSGCSEKNFCIYYFSPYLNNSLVQAILGEDNKWVPMSTQRITNIDDTQPDKLSVQVKGAPGENVNFWIVILDELVRKNCTLGPSESTKTCTLFEFWNNSARGTSSITCIILAFFARFFFHQLF